MSFPHTWYITTVTETAQARAAVARIAEAHGLPAVERTRLATTFSAHWARSN